MFCWIKLGCSQSLKSLNFLGFSWYTVSLGSGSTVVSIWQSSGVDNQTPCDDLTGKLENLHKLATSIAIQSNWDLILQSSEQPILGLCQSSVVSKSLIQRGNAWVPFSHSPMDVDCSSLLHYDSIQNKHICRVWSNLLVLSSKQVQQGWERLKVGLSYLVLTSQD